MATAPKKTLNIFYSYAHADQDYRDQLERHLSNLKRRYNFQTWFDRQIQAGDNWEEVLEDHLNTADLIFLLVSPDFMYSDYCYNKEMTRALERHARGEAKVIPILVRWVHWTDAPFSHIQLLPTDARPIKSWTDMDDAFYNVVLEVEKAIQHLLLLRKTKEEWLEEGDALYGLKRYEEALSAYEQVIRLDPTNAIAYNNEGYALYRLKRHGEALTAYEQAIRLDPNNAVAYLSKGEALNALKRYEEALSVLEQAIRLDSNNVVAYNNKGFALSGLKRHEEALFVLEQAIRLNPNYAIAYLNKGSTLNALKRYEEALSALEQAIRLNPNNAVIYNNKGYALSGLKRHGEALFAYERAIRLDSNNAVAYNNKGDALNELRRYKEAQEAYDKAKELGFS